MPKICGQVSTPTVDETQLECEELSLSTCIEIKKICPKIGNLPGENLDKFIERLCFKIAKMDNTIFDLKKRIKILEGNNNN